MSILEQYSDDFFTIDYFYALIPGLPDEAYPIICRNANKRMNKQMDDLIKNGQGYVAPEPMNPLPPDV